MEQSQECVVTTLDEKLGPGVGGDPAHLSVMHWNSAQSAVVNNTLHSVPRIGEKHQAVVQCLINLPDCKAQWCNAESNKGIEGDQHLNEGIVCDDIESFAWGLPVLVMEIHRPSIWYSFSDECKCCKSECIHKEDIVSYNNNDVLQEQLLEDSLKASTAVPRQIPHKSQFTCNSSHGAAVTCFDDLGVSKHENSFPMTSDDPEGVDANANDDSKNAGSVGMYASHRKRRKRKGYGSWTKVKRTTVQTTNSAKSQRKSSKAASFLAGLLNKSAAVSAGKIVLVPGSPSASWSENDVAAFITGIYLFGKDFRAMKRFLETKRMLDISAFYYGTFYGTEFYSRWAETRKGKNRKCIHGVHLLTGWRQQELLKRLFSHMNKLAQEEIMKAFDNFNNKEMSQEELVIHLKSATSLDILVRAIGLGAGKLDLTAVHIDPGSSSNSGVFHYDIPAGRACSSLTNEEIIIFLNGNIRISKARANDLFWEAVWPRLLARGWSSEEVGDQGISGPQGSLVFIIPGVPDARHVLEKGVHYYDSISAVLNLVAVNSKLLDPPSDFLPVEERWDPTGWLVDKSPSTSGGSSFSLHESPEINDET